MFTTAVSMWQIICAGALAICGASHVNCEHYARIWKNGRAVQKLLRESSRHVCRDDQNCPQFELHRQKLLDELDYERRSFLKSAFVASGGPAAAWAASGLLRRRRKRVPASLPITICRRLLTRYIGAISASS